MSGGEGWLGGGKAGYVSVFHINLPFKFLFSDSWTWCGPFQRLVLAFPEKNPADFVSEEGSSAGVGVRGVVRVGERLTVFTAPEVFRLSSLLELCPAS